MRVEVGHAPEGHLSTAIPFSLGLDLLIYRTMTPVTRAQTLAEEKQRNSLSLGKSKRTRHSAWS